MAIEYTELKERITALGFIPNDALVAKVLELHAKSVPEATIRKAWRILDTENREARRREKAANKNSGTPAASTPATPPAQASSETPVPAATGA